MEQTVNSHLLCVRNWTDQFTCSMVLSSSFKILPASLFNETLSFSANSKTCLAAPMLLGFKRLAHNWERMGENTGNIRDRCSFEDWISPPCICSWSSNCLHAPPIHLHWFKTYIYSSQRSSVELSQNLQIKVLLLPRCSHSKLCDLLGHHGTLSTLHDSYLTCFLSTATLPHSLELHLIN